MAHQHQTPSANSWHPVCSFCRRIPLLLLYFKPQQRSMHSCLRLVLRCVSLEAEDPAEELRKSACPAAESSASPDLDLYSIDSCCPKTLDPGMQVLVRARVQAAAAAASGLYCPLSMRASLHYSALQSCCPFASACCVQSH